MKYDPEPKLVPPPIARIKYIAAGDGANWRVRLLVDTKDPFRKQSNVEVEPLYLHAAYDQFVNGPAEEIVEYGAD